MVRVQGAFGGGANRTILQPACSWRKFRKFAIGISTDQHPRRGPT